MSDTEDEVVAAAVTALIAVVAESEAESRKPYKRRKIWADPFFDPAARGGVLNEMLISNRFGYKKTLRVSEEEFNFLLRLVDPLIRKKDTNMRQSVSPQVRLGATLRFLANGLTYEDLVPMVKVSHSVLQKAVPETCEALAKVLQHFMKVSFKLKIGVSLNLEKIFKECRFL